MTIYVVHKNDYDGKGIEIYIGRPSLFGNPYSHLKRGTLAKYKVKTRQEAIEAYREYFIYQIMGNKVFYAELNRIKELSKNNDVYLLCWCKPLACHGDIIKEYLDQNP